MHNKNGHARGVHRSRPHKKRLLSGLLVAVATALFAAGSAQAAIAPVTNDAAGATALATAMAANPANLTGASFDTTPPFGTPHGVSDGLNEFPTDGPTFAIITSGDVNLADDPNNSGSTGQADGGGAVRGVSDRDVSILKINLNVPAGSNCLAFDFKFFSDEFPEFVGSNVSDSFIAELDTSDWTTTGGGNPPTAPHNFAFDQFGNPISINTSGPLAMSAGEAAGTTYDGATPLLRAQTAVTPGPHVLYLSIFDQGDQIYDSATFLDNLVIGFVPDPATQCASGATPVVFDLSLSPPSATNTVGSPHTVTATLTENGSPKAGATINFTVTGVNPTSGTGITDANGQATFTYTGTNTGGDTIVACYDADTNGTCGNAGDPIASATKQWVGPGGGDGTPPTCSLIATITGPPKQIQVMVQDTGSGLATIVVTQSVNAATVVPPFAPGTNDPVVVTSTKIDQTQASTLALQVTDVAGNVTNCDPVVPGTKRRAHPASAHRLSSRALVYLAKLRRGEA